MQYIDPQMESRVWARVTGGAAAPADSPDLLALIEEKLSDGAAYLHLSRFFSGSHSRILRQMHQQEQSHAACLKGIYRMMTGKRPVPQLPKPMQEPPADALRRCYDREVRCAAQYKARAKDPRFGQTFARLAARETEHAKLLLELLGTLP